MTNTVYTLDDLRAISLPQPVSFRPAAGGWIIIGIIAMIAIRLLFIAVKKYRSNAYRREGLHLLKELQINSNNSRSATVAANISVILKRAALATYPREQVASLTGNEWLCFLDKTYEENKFSSKPGSLLGDTVHRKPNADSIDSRTVKDLFVIAETWIRQHKPGGTPC